jgi:hypothetical protein
VTTRLKAVIVTFQVDLREDDAEPLMQAIRQLRGVADVSPVPSNSEDHCARAMVRSELLLKIIELFNKT